SLQNIQTELEEKEMEAWQKLIRVLTHEIMNSVTPISSLASTVGDLLERGQKDEETIKDIKLAIDTIKRRSDGLIKFVDSYRSLTRIPKPDFQIFQIRELFHRINQLMSIEFRKAGVHFEYSVEPDSLELAADPQLIEQALINMTLNSMQSLSESDNKKIKLAAHLDDRGKTVIKVIDNGPGISEELQEKIFIPFFSTKKEGSGIGLSLSRQIMRSHGGSIRISSKPFVETVFTLKFN
ncbi:MAG TPA: ATP-binding protein, partial [Ignavibacteriales bacterium]|nr:ATP-binding protein [Ignavibacteriales bacterium]